MAQQSNLQRGQTPSRASQPPSYFATTFPESLYIPSTNGDLLTPGVECPTHYMLPRNSVSSSSSSFASSISVQHQPPLSSSSSINALVTDTESIDLPSYSVGSDIQPITTKSGLTPRLRVSISNRKSSYDIGDIIHGTIMLCPTKPIDIASVFIVLEGEEATNKSTWTSNIHTTRKLNLAHYVVPAISLPPDMKAQPGFVYTFFFSIQVPEILPSGVCKNDILEHTRIPPSFGSPPEISIPQNNIPDNAARINYRLRACTKVVSEKDSSTLMTYGTALSYIHVIPSYTLSPGAIQRVHQHPYVHRQDLKKGMMKKTCTGIVQLQLQKLSALPIYSPGPVGLPLRVSIMPSNDDLSLPPPRISQISTKLISQTLYSSELPFTTSPPLEQGQNVNCVIQKIILGHLSNLESHWKLDMATATQERSKAAYSVEFDLPISIPQQNKLIVPTFESCFVARDYTLSVSVYFQDKTSVSITVPVNLVASLSPRSNFPFGDAMASFTGSNNNSLPYYSQNSGHTRPHSRAPYPTSSNNSGSGGDSYHQTHPPYPTNHRRCHISEKVF